MTQDDYQRLSLNAPGIDVGRVEVLPRFKPQDRRFDVPGVVSVMALPNAPLAPAPNPRPDRPLIERLYNYLSARTPLATELYVIGCEYVPLGLSVAVSLRDGYPTPTRPCSISAKPCAACCGRWRREVSTRPAGPSVAP